MTEVERLIQEAESLDDRQSIEYFPMAVLDTMERLIKTVKEQHQQLMRLKEIAFADQTDYLIVGTLRQELSPSQTGEDVV